MTDERWETIRFRLLDEWPEEVIADVLAALDSLQAEHEKMRVLLQRAESTLEDVFATASYRDPLLDELADILSHEQKGTTP